MSIPETRIIFSVAYFIEMWRMLDMQKSPNTKSREKGDYGDPYLEDFLVDETYVKRKRNRKKRRKAKRHLQKELEMLEP